MENTGHTFRTNLVTIDNRHGGKDTIHRVDCRFVVAADPSHIGSVRTGKIDARIFRTCGVCLKGSSTFRLPVES